MKDYIYDNATVPVIRNKFPHVKVEDASDFSHPDRVEITLPDADRDEFYKLAIKDGYSDVSITFQILLLQKDGRKEISRWLKEMEKNEQK